MDGTIGLNIFAKWVRTSFIIMVTVLVFQVNPWVAEAQQLPSPLPYQQLRYDEDYSYLRDPTRRTEFWDITKYIPFNDKGAWIAASLPAMPVRKFSTGRGQISRRSLLGVALTRHFVKNEQSDYV